MKIRATSDLHLEFHFSANNSVERKKVINDIVPHLDDDLETILLVNGDVACASKIERIVNFFEDVAPRFKHVIYVLGNHEHYNGNINTTQENIGQALSSFSNITVVGNTTESIEIGNVLFVAATLWTDYGAKNFDYTHEARKSIESNINDHRMIANFVDSSGKSIKFSTEDGALLHKNALNTMIEIFENNKNKKVVVCTHHLPSFAAVSPRFMRDHFSKLLNHAFASDLDWLIEKYSPLYWFFGHTHDPQRFKIGETELICNPYGYPNERSSGKYDPTLMVEV